MKHYNPHGSGGAVQVQASNVEITDTVFKKNKAKGPGGACFNDGTLWEKPGGYIRIERTRFIGNQGGGQGGALFSFNYKEVKPGSGAGEGTLTIRNVEFIENRVNVREVSADGSGGKRYDSTAARRALATAKDDYREHAVLQKRRRR